MSIKKVNNRYRVRVSTIINGKQKQLERTAHSYSEAKQLEQKLLIQLKNPNEITLTIKELSEEYIKFKEIEVRKSSLLKIERIIRLHIVPQLEDYPIENLSIKVLQDWKLNLAKKDYVITTKQDIFTTFKAMLGYAVTMEYLEKNNLEKLGNIKDVELQTETSKIQYYTSEQFQTYIQYIRSNSTNIIDWTLYVFFNLAFFTGARKGEINALKWNDINNNIAHIQRSINKAINVVTAPKNKASIRFLQLPDPLIRVLDEHKERLKQADMYDDDSYICVGITNARIDNLNIIVAKELQLPRIRIHDFRHSHASLLINHNINIMEIARRLGHSKVEMTWNTYGHLYPHEEGKAIDILNTINPL